ncbi:MAG: sugar ABC transporter substrate-binding protein [Sphaerochaetaceae bacterium]
MKKLSVLLLIVIMAITCVFATGDNEKTATVKQLDFFWWSDGQEGVAMQALIDEYEQMHSDIKINLIEVPFADVQNKIMMSVAGGEAPALTRTTEGISNQLYEAFVDFGEYTDGEALKSHFVSSIESYYVKNDKIISVPSDVTANGLIVNKTMFDKAGVTLPSGPDDIWTWDEFKKALIKVKAANNLEYAIAIDNASHRWSTILYEFGGSFANKNGGNFTSDNSIRCIEYTKALADEGLFNASTWITFEDAGILFRSQLVAAQICGTWCLEPYHNNITEFEWCATYMPVDVKRSSTPGGKQFAVLQDSGVEQEAVDFVLWATEKEQNQRYCEQSLFVSPRLDCAELKYPYRSSDFAVFANELANTGNEGAFDWGYPGLSAAFGVDVTYDFPKVLSGKMTVMDFAEKINKDINDFMGK